MFRLYVIMFYVSFLIGLINTLVAILFTRTSANILNDDDNYIRPGCLDQENHADVRAMMVFAISTSLISIIPMISASIFGMNRMSIRQAQELPPLSVSLRENGVNDAEISRRARIARMLPLPLILFFGSLLPSSSVGALSYAIHLLNDLQINNECLVVTASDLKVLDKIIYYAASFSKIELLALGLMLLSYDGYIRLPTSIFFNSMRARVPNINNEREEEQLLIEAQPRLG